MMDGDRFDALSRSVASPATRRGALGGMIASGFLAALGIRAAAQDAQDAQDAQEGTQAKEAKQAQGTTCVIDFAATVRQGPSNGQPAGEVRGELSFGLSSKGALEDATLRLDDDSSLPVVGQATGHALQIRIQLAENQALVAMGVGEEEIARCQGAIDGMVTGPAGGDLGDWHAVVVRSTGDGETKDKEKDKKAKETTQQAAGAGGAATQKPDKKERKNAEQQGGSGGREVAPAPAGADDSTDAPETETRQNRCPNGQSNCNGTCVDLSSDPANCGACGTACGDASCVSGVCTVAAPETATCEPGLTDCGGICVDPSSDPANCGSCGAACAESDDCVGGVCQPMASACPNPGETDCGGTCVITATDPANCGACGVACPAGNECSDGACVAPTGPPDNCAPQGLTACAGFCVDIATDAANCGACGVVCAPEQSCVGGTCQAGAAPAAQPLTCPAGETDCGGVCVDLSSDFGNCGACGVACGESQGCVDGQCADQTAAPPTNCAAIGPTFVDCSGVCVDVQADPSNCGGCGVVCPNQCAGGVCA